LHCVSLTPCKSERKERERGREEERKREEDEALWTAPHL
jgi:hypothetical protein